MNSRSIQSISKQVGKRFPEMQGKQPKVTQQKSGEQANFLVTYSGQVAGPGGKMVHRSVRVVANEHGKILKMSSSK